MANPQPDQYTKLANELLEQVPRFKLNGTQLRIILVIWRYTYGFQRKERELSVGFIAEAMQASKSQVDRELTALIERNVITVVSDPIGKPRVIRFNKDYSTWEPSRRPRNGGQLKGVLQNEVTPTAKMSTVPTAKTRSKKLKKETPKENTLSVYERIINYLNEKTGKRYSAKSEPNKRLINGRLSEGRTVEDFLRVIDVKVSHWLDDEKMNEYLRPDTLFRASNFDKYLNQQPMVQARSDQEIEARNRQIDFDNKLREWVNAGNDAADFRYEPEHP